MSSSDAGMRRARATRDAFKEFVPITTRWADVDVYGHVNNVQYYSYFDTAVTESQIRGGIMAVERGDVLSYVVESSCTYFDGLTFPGTIEVGMVIERLGTSSLAYFIGVFRRGETQAAAQGRFVHVYVDAKTQRPIPLPADVRAYGETLLAT